MKMRSAGYFVRTSLFSWGMMAVALLFLWPYGQSYAQQAHGKARGQAVDMCAFEPESIARLRGPSFGFPGVWDARFELANAQVELSDALYRDGTAVAVGRILERGTGAAKETILIDLNRRGRAIMDQRFAVKNDERPARVVQAGNGFVVLSGLQAGKQNGWGRVAWYDKDGKFRHERIVREEGQSLTPTSLLALEGGGVMAVFIARDPRDSARSYSVIARMDGGGKIIWRRAFRAGEANQLHAITPFAGDYMAAGQIREGGRDAGWLMRMDGNGVLVWQRSYRRGASSILRHVAMMENTPHGYHYLVASGDSAPSDGTAGAAWLMVADHAGAPVWQRYYHAGHYDFSAKGVAAHADGRITLLVNAQGREDEQDHYRLLTISPQGAMLRMESYVEGAGTRASSLYIGARGERVVAANALVDVPVSASLDEALAPVRVPPESIGWIMVGQPLGVYEDPCAKRGAR